MSLFKAALLLVVLVLSASGQEITEAPAPATSTAEPDLDPAGKVAPNMCPDECYMALPTSADCSTCPEQASITLAGDLSAMTDSDKATTASNAESAYAAASNGAITMSDIASTRLDPGSIVVTFTFAPAVTRESVVQSVAAVNAQIASPGGLAVAVVQGGVETPSVVTTAWQDSLIVTTTAGTGTVSKKAKKMKVKSPKNGPVDPLSRDTITTKKTTKKKLKKGKKAGKKSTLASAMRAGLSGSVPEGVAAAVCGAGVAMAAVLALLKRRNSRSVEGDEPDEATALIDGADYTQMCSQLA